MRSAYLRHQVIKASLAIAGCCCFSTTTQAVQFQFGELEGEFDSSLSLGASWSTQSPKTSLIGTNNGGTGSSSAGDDGRLNFRKGDTFSKLFKGSHDLDLRYGDSGLFARGKYWYDFELKDESQRFQDISDSNRKEGAKSAGAELLDLFVYHKYEINGLPGTVRFGKQVVSWGESTFITGGINSINPVDVSALRRPGAEIKEGLIPVNMFYVSQSLTDSLSFESFYQLDWEQTVVDNCGTFFGTDTVADGCNRGNTVGPNVAGNALAHAALDPFGIQLTNQGILIPRAGDNDARNSGQWGAALRWFSDPLNTEFGGYFMNYHSRTPYYSMITGNHAADMGFAGGLCGNLGITSAATCSGVLNSSAGSSLVSAYRLGTSKYYIDYPEDIRLYGLSFSTTLPTGTALQGEFTYRPNAPLQINTTDLTLAALGLSDLSPVYSNGTYSVANDHRLAGYQRKEVSQFQVTATHFFDQVMGADRLTLVGEVALVHTGGLGGKYGLRYGREAVYGQGVLQDNALCQSSTNTANPQNCNNDGFTTSNAWGYRARAQWEYRNAFKGITLRPNLAWSHDVKGYGPTTNPLNEGSKAISLGLDAEYDSTYTASLAYTNYFGGDFNNLIDRDYVALSVGVNF